MRHAQPSRLLFIAIVFLTGLVLPTTHAQQVSNSWNGGTGNWSVSTDWTPTAVPNNGGGTTYSVTVNNPSSLVTMDVLNDTIDNLALGTSASLTIAGGNSLNLVSGQSSNYGTLNNGVPDVVGSAGGTLTNSGTLYNYGTFNNGVISSGGSTLTNSGSLFCCIFHVAAPAKGTLCSPLELHLSATLRARDQPCAQSRTFAGKIRTNLVCIQESR
jgi:hypothetical protein